MRSPTVAPGRRKFTFILRILSRTTVSPTFLHFKKAIYSRLSPSKPTLFVSSPPSPPPTAAHLHTCISAYQHSYLCSVLFSTPRLVKARLPGIKQSEILFPPTCPTAAREFTAKSSPLRQKLRGSLLKLGTLLFLTHHLILSPVFGHVQHRGLMPLTALFDTHSSAPAQSPGATVLAFHLSALPVKKPPYSSLHFKICYPNQSWCTLLRFEHYTSVM